MSEKKPKRKNDQELTDAVFGQLEIDSLKWKCKLSTYIAFWRTYLLLSSSVPSSQGRAGCSFGGFCNSKPTRGFILGLRTAIWGNVGDPPIRSSKRRDVLLKLLRRYHKKSTFSGDNEFEFFVTPSFNLDVIDSDPAVQKVSLCTSTPCL